MPRTIFYSSRLPDELTENQRLISPEGGLGLVRCIEKGTLSGDIPYSIFYPAQMYKGTMTADFNCKTEWTVKELRRRGVKLA